MEPTTIVTQHPLTFASMQSDSDDDFQQSSSNRSGSHDQTALRNALHFAVGNICREEEENGEEGTPRMSKEAINTLTQMTYHYATKCLATDLIAFSQHANRKTLTVDDVKLVARKNPRGLMHSLEGFCDHQSSTIRDQKMNDFMNNNLNPKESSKKRSRKNISGGNELGLGEGGSGLKMHSNVLGDSDSSDDDLGPSSNLVGNDTEKVNFDIQIEESSSSSDSDSDDSGSSQLKLKTAQLQNQEETKEEKSLLDDSSDDNINFSYKKNQGKPQKKDGMGEDTSSGIAIELSDSD